MNNGKELERLQRGLSLLGYTADGASHAATGSEYHIFSRADGSGELVIRFANHGECYCREDFSIDPQGLSAAKVLAIIAKREGKSLRTLQLAAAKERRSDLASRRGRWINAYAAQEGVSMAEAARLCPIDK